MGRIIKKLLIICGPTATGKTKLALALAKKFNGELISADSRQVYKYMDIGTGKDVKGILGYDLVRPDQEFSVSQYVQFANKTIQEIYERGHLPILVGGTGFYIKAVVDGIATADIFPDKVMRANLQNKTAEELFKILKNIDFVKATNMNDSDNKNPRRLIRAIEVADNQDENVKEKNNKYDALFIGLNTDKETLKKLINKRVDERIQKGFEREINFLKDKNYWNGAPRFTLGYKDWPDIDKWKLEEFKYAKRQITWFKKEIRINWFDLNSEKEVENLTQKWYSQTNND
ncbi:tRNA (adenosine(37)-N6)-dimethylallyltransferase MiaA [soil metagenome]